MQFSPIIPPPRKIAREDAENSEMLHKWLGTNAIGTIVGDGVLDVPPAPEGRVAENLRFSVGRPGGRPLQVRIRRGAAIIVGVYCGTVDARSLHWVSLFVGAIHESPADAERHRKIPRHCEEPPGDVAIPWYKDHPENRRDCHAAFAARNDVITGRAIHESPLQNTQKIPRFRRNGGFRLKIVLSNTPSGY